jgi:hypothetical protein
MKFRTAELGYKNTPDYPYDYRIELLEYSLTEREQLTDWLTEYNIPCTVAGWNTGSVLYMRKEHIAWFILRWS